MIKTPVRMEITGGAACEIIDAEDYCIARALGTLKDDVYSPPEYWGQQIADALNDAAKLASAVEVIRHYARSPSPVHRHDCGTCNHLFHNHDDNGCQMECECKEFRNLDAAEWLEENEK